MNEVLELRKRLSELEELKEKIREANLRLSLMVEGTSYSISKGFLHRLTQSLAAALTVHYAFVSEIVDESISRVRLLSFWIGDAHGENFEYAIQGTPCEQVVARRLSCFPSDVQKQFPEDLWLQESGIQSYLAIPLFDSAGSPLGHLGVMDKKNDDRNARQRIHAEDFRGAGCDGVGTQQDGRGFEGEPEDASHLDGQSSGDGLPVQQ